MSYWWSHSTFETKPEPLSLTVSAIFNVECNYVTQLVSMTLIRPVNEGQGHLFWYQSISYIRLTSNFCSRTHRISTIHSVYRRQTANGRKPVAKARPYYVRSAKNSDSEKEKFYKTRWLLEILPHLRMSLHLSSWQTRIIRQKWWGTLPNFVARSVQTL